VSAAGLDGIEAPRQLSRNRKQSEQSMKQKLAVTHTTVGRAARWCGRGYGDEVVCRVDEQPEQSSHTRLQLLASGREQSSERTDGPSGSKQSVTMPEDDERLKLVNRGVRVNGGEDGEEMNAQRGMELLRTGEGG
jgi:hypothetical protein